MTLAIQDSVGCMVNHQEVSILFIGPSRTLPIWVFWMVDTSVTPAQVYMGVVAQRNAATLLPIIQQHVASGSTVSA